MVRQPLPASSFTSEFTWAAEVVPAASFPAERWAMGSL